MGWLHSAPKSKIKDAVSKSRIESLPEDDPLHELPDVDDCADLIFAFHRSGRLVTNGMGHSPLPWSEIDAFCDRSGLDYRGWNALQLRIMSEKYCSWLSLGAEHGCLPPYQRDITQDEINTRAKAASDEMDRFIDLHNASLSNNRSKL